MYNIFAMLIKLENLLNKFVGLFFIVAFILAIFLPSTAKLLQPYIVYLLILLLFLGFIRIDFSMLRSEILGWKYQSYLLFLTLLLVPIIIYYLAHVITDLDAIPDDFALAALLIFCVPTGASTPTICNIFNGRLERTMLNIVATYLLVPITLPLLIWVLLRHDVKLDLSYLAVFIGTVIIIPLLLALLVRKTVPVVSNKLSSIAPLASLVIIFCIIFASGSELPRLTEHSLETVFMGFILAIFLFVVTFILGWWLAFKHQPVDKITTAMLAAYPNIGLALVLADQFFAAAYPETVLLIMTCMIVWPLAIMPTRWMLNIVTKDRNAN